jgi:ABC-type bacteriocin/lantibiotic exporter with double-glycine peptidase domain
MAPGGAGSPHFDRGLQVEQIEFTYPGRTEPVLRQVTWELRIGQAIALVGDSGAGKTTMLDLVTGLLRPTGGRITIDGVDLADIDLEQWQAHLGLVPQEAPLFAGSVLENVYWMETRHDPEAARHALELAHAVEFVDRLPQGMATVLGQRAATLSGGQRQRLALARALYRQPWVLVLDEPTSALDSEAELEVLRALEEAKSTCAMIIVSHGLNPVRLAGHIYVMADGTVAEHGSWEELAGRPDGRFARIVRQRATHT